MYSRRLKLKPKKPKATSKKPAGPGSNWGPRLALIERERQLAVEGDEEELFEIHHEIVHSVSKRSNGNKGTSYGGGGGKSDVDPLLRLGRSSSPNYFYYNYSRRTAPNANNPGTRKISCPEAVRPSQNGGGGGQGQYQKSQSRRASYVLGSSSGYCSGSVMTLSNCANGEQFKPLTLIIPPQERLYGEMRGGGGGGAGGFRLRNDEFEGDGAESFPSSSQYQSSGDEGGGGDKRGMVARRRFNNPMANMRPRPKPVCSGILQISTKDHVQVHHPPPQSQSPGGDEFGTGTEPETLELANDEEHSSGVDGNNNKAQAITMVYVPMNPNPKMVGSSNPPKGGGDRGRGNSSSTDSDSYSGEDPLPEYNEPVDLPELDNDCSSASSQGESLSGGSKGPEDSLSSNFILKRKTTNNSTSQEHGRKMTTGADNFLDSFDSVLFKPKSAQNHNFQEKGIRKRPEQPPPLPPQNHEKQKSLRFALENLETVLNPGKTPPPSSSENDSVTPPATSSSGAKKVLKKVTLSLPGEDNSTMNRNHELLLNYEELNNCASEILSCGHVRSDNDYSTLSSLTSSAQEEISDFDDNTFENRNSSQHQPNENSSGSASESERGEPAGKPGNEAPPQTRSVLQQLRDLSRLIRGSSPQSKNNSKEHHSIVHFTEANSFFLHQTVNHNNNHPHPPQVKSVEDLDSKRKTSDATDNSADSGKGSGTSASCSGSSGQEGSPSSSSAEPSPSCVEGGGSNNVRQNGVGVVCKVGEIHPPRPNAKPHSSNNRRLKVATIRGRGGGIRGGNSAPPHHYSMTDDGGGCQGQDNDSCCSSQRSECSCASCCDYRSDCTECIIYQSKSRPSLFPKPSNSEELCSNEVASNGGGSLNGGVQSRLNKKGGAGTVSSSSSKNSNRPVSKIVRRTSSRVRGARRTPSLKRAKIPPAPSTTGHQRKPVILDYCDCANCDNCDFDDCEEYDEEEEQSPCCPDTSCRPPPPPRNYRSNQRNNPPPPHHEPLLIPIRNPHGKLKGNRGTSTDSSSRKISSSSGSSGVSSSSSGKLSRISAFRSSSALVQQQQQQQQPHTSTKSNLLRKSDAAATGASLSNPVSIVVPPPVPTSAGNLFTIDEANEDSVYGESGGGGGGSAGPIVIGKCNNNGNSRSKTPPRPLFNLQNEEGGSGDLGNGKRSSTSTSSRSRSSSEHTHPKCWLQPDATLGWSDLESLYSQNMKVDTGKPTPPVLRDECPTCWRELSEMKKNCPDPNRTVDRTKRMFIWLNRRHKEFHAPWWEAKKQASMRWLLTKAFTHVAKDKVPDPFKESKKGKPTKYSLRDDIVKGLISGKLYCMALDALYRSQQNNYHLSQNLTHWEIIKILSRRGIYIAQPSDMKLTEATLRQKKPIRTAAHIALIEALMGLYAKEILGRDRIAQTLRSFGKVIDPDTNSPERLVVSWINTAVTTLKSYILSNAQQHLPTNKVNRWMNLPEVGEIRDLCDGVGVCALFALYCSNDLKVDEISVPEPGDTLTIYDSITNHSLVQKLCDDLFPEPIYHLCVTDFLYIHGCMKQNILCFLVDLFVHLEINPILRVNRLTHVPIRVQL